MSRTILRLRDKYLEWSSVTNSPVTFGVEASTFIAYLRMTYGPEGLKDRAIDLEWARKYGVGQRLASYDRTRNLVKFIEGNRAGPDEAELNLYEIYQAYCERKPIRDNWLVPEVT